MHIAVVPLPLGGAWAAEFGKVIDQDSMERLTGQKMVCTLAHSSLKGAPPFSQLARSVRRPNLTLDNWVAANPGLARDEVIYRLATYDQHSPSPTEPSTRSPIDDPMSHQFVITTPQSAASQLFDPLKSVVIPAMIESVPCDGADRCIKRSAKCKNQTHTWTLKAVMKARVAVSGVAWDESHKDKTNILMANFLRSMRQYEARSQGGGWVPIVTMSSTPMADGPLHPFEKMALQLQELEVDEDHSLRHLSIQELKRARQQIDKVHALTARGEFDTELFDLLRMATETDADAHPPRILDDRI